MKKFILPAVLAMFMFSCSESNDIEPIEPTHPIEIVPEHPIEGEEEIDPDFGKPGPENPIEGEEDVDPGFGRPGPENPIEEGDDVDPGFDNPNKDPKN